MFNTLVHGYNLVRHDLRDVSTGGERSGHWPTVEKHFKESHPVCAVCGGTDRLQVHHQKPFHLDPALELDVNNLITLCMGEKECHLQIGHGDDFKAYNPEVATDAETLRHHPSQFTALAAHAKANRKYQV